MKLLINSQRDFARLAQAFEGEFDSDCNLSLEIVDVDEAEIRRLNREIRCVDAVTDVLSFPALDGICGKKINKKDFPFDLDENGDVFLGSIAICINAPKNRRKSTDIALCANLIISPRTAYAICSVTTT